MAKKIAVGIATRERLKLLDGCLTSLANIKIPKQAELCFIIVENDEELTIEPVIEKFKLSLIASGNEQASINVGLEPEIGISSARNKVMDMAMAAKCDFLAFIDDDERARTDWLVELMEMQDNTNADLVGGPVWRVCDPSANFGLFQRIVSKALLRHYNKAKPRKMRRSSIIATGNWLCCMKFVEENLLRFDTSLQLTGSEDVKFDKDLVAAGGRKAWAEKAVVEEIVTADRVSLNYIFTRERETQKTLFLVKKKYRKGYLYALGEIFSMALFGILCRAILIPFDNGRSLVKIVMKAGRLTGHIEAVFGHSGSNIYRTVTGD